MTAPRAIDGERLDVETIGLAVIVEGGVAEVAFQLVDRAGAKYVVSMGAAELRTFINGLEHVAALNAGKSDKRRPVEEDEQYGEAPGDHPWGQR